MLLLPWVLVGILSLCVFLQTRRIRKLENALLDLCDLPERASAVDVAARLSYGEDPE